MARRKIGFGWVVGVPVVVTGVVTLVFALPVANRILGGGGELQLTDQNQGAGSDAPIVVPLGGPHLMSRAKDSPWGIFSVPTVGRWMTSLFGPLAFSSVAGSRQRLFSELFAVAGFAETGSGYSAGFSDLSRYEAFARDGIWAQGPASWAQFGVPAASLGVSNPANVEIAGPHPRSVTAGSNALTDNQARTIAVSSGSTGSLAPAVRNGSAPENSWVPTPFRVMDRAPVGRETAGPGFETRLDWQTPHPGLLGTPGTATEVFQEQLTGGAPAGPEEAPSPSTFGGENLLFPATLAWDDGDPELLAESTSEAAAAGATAFALDTVIVNPEPASLGLLATGLAAIAVAGAWKRRGRSRVS